MKGDRLHWCMEGRSMGLLLLLHIICTMAVPSFYTFIVKGAPELGDKSIIFYSVLFGTNHMDGNFVGVSFIQLIDESMFASRFE